LKIFVCSIEFPPDLGGAGVVARQNAETLGSMDHPVTVVIRKSKKSRVGFGFKIIEPSTNSRVWLLDFINMVQSN